MFLEYLTINNDYILGIIYCVMYLLSVKNCNNKYIRKPNISRLTFFVKKRKKALENPTGRNKSKKKMFWVFIIFVVVILYRQSLNRIIDTLRLKPRKTVPCLNECAGVWDFVFENMLHATYNQKKKTSESTGCQCQGINIVEQAKVKNETKINAMQQI